MLASTHCSGANCGTFLFLFVLCVTQCIVRSSLASVILIISTYVIQKGDGMNDKLFEIAVAFGQKKNSSLNKKYSRRARNRFVCILYISYLWLILISIL